MERPDQRTVASLPDDVLAAVFRRLVPRCLAASRCVCKPWRDLVDSRRLLRADLLPRSLAGIFINYYDLPCSEFFARPSTTTGSTAISGHLDEFIPDKYHRHQVEDHCNVLLLIRHTGYVVNPATRWWTRLPPYPPPRKEMDYFHIAYLVFDPVVSSHYEVFLMPLFHHKCRPHFFHNGQDPMEAWEWPPASYAVPTFSSREGVWQDRSFVREGEAACTIADMRSDWPFDRRNGVYWRGAIYVHCQTNFFIRISLNDDKYRVIKPPENSDGRYLAYFYLGRSEKGVYLASSGDGCLKVWTIDETYSEIRWELKYSNKVKHVLRGRNNRQGLGPWILQDINFHTYPEIYEDDIMDKLDQNKVKWDPSEEAALEKFEWTSDDESVPDNEDRVTGGYHNIIGFHPYKEIIFLGESLERALAYHLSSSKAESIGYLYPSTYNLETCNNQSITASFPYTPCLM
uniref:F-box domain-containing protein n=1 Tax=Leersia perrieri TaxID=77586 RepID=A0A0D9VX97_9ORYZ